MNDVNKALLAQSTFYRKTKVKKTTVNKTKKIAVLSISDQDLLSMHNEVMSISESNPHKPELARLMKKPIFIQKDREHFLSRPSYM